MPLRIVRLEASRLRAAKSAGRHPCSTAWRDVRGLRPALLPLNLVVLKLKIPRTHTTGEPSTGEFRLRVRQHLPNRGQVGFVH
jgi:hypothetical protein